MSEESKKEITALIEPTIITAGFELVELKLARYGRNSRLQLFIHADRGITIDDCVKVSRQIETSLENSELFPGEFTIEVSSPGIDRPLVSERDFQRRLGRAVQIEFHQKGRKTLKGTITKVENGAVSVAGKKGEDIVTLTDIKLAKEIIVF